MASLATTSGIQVNGIGILDFTGTGTLTQTISLTQTGTVRVAAGNLITVAA